MVHEGEAEVRRGGHDVGVDVEEGRVEAALVREREPRRGPLLEADRRLERRAPRAELRRVEPRGHARGARVGDEPLVARAEQEDGHRGGLRQRDGRAGLDVEARGPHGVLDGPRARRGDLGRDDGVVEADVPRSPVAAPPRRLGRVPRWPIAAPPRRLGVEGERGPGGRELAGLGRREGAAGLGRRGGDEVRVREGRVERAAPPPGVARGAEGRGDVAAGVVSVDAGEHVADADARGGPERGHAGDGEAAGPGLEAAELVEGRAAGHRVDALAVGVAAREGDRRRRARAREGLADARARAAAVARRGDELAVDGRERVAGREAQRGGRGVRGAHADDGARAPGQRAAHGHARGPAVAADDREGRVVARREGEGRRRHADDVLAPRGQLQRDVVAQHGLPRVDRRRRMAEEHAVSFGKLVRAAPWSLASGDARHGECGCPATNIGMLDRNDVDVAAAPSVDGCDVRLRAASVGHCECPSAVSPWTSSGSARRASRSSAS